MDENDYIVVDDFYLPYGDGENGNGYGTSQLNHYETFDQYGDGSSNNGAGDGSNPYDRWL